MKARSGDLPGRPRAETYHHWQVFSHGADGVCIEFDSEKLRAAFDRAGAGGVRHQIVDYQLITQVNKMSDVDVERLPFMKRWPYGDEASTERSMSIRMKNGPHMQCLSR